MRRQGGDRAPAGTRRAGRTPVNTYYSANDRRAGRSPFQRRAAPGGGRKKLVLGFLDIILVGLLFAGLVYSLIVTPKPKIILNSTAFHSRAEYQIEADKLFSSFKNRNKVTFGQNSVTDGLKKKFPEITSVNVELPIFSQQPTLRLDISKASLRLKSGGSEYIVDSQGVIVSSLASLSYQSELPEVIDQSGFAARPGSRILSASSVNFIRTLNAECKRAGIPLTSMTLPPVAQELDLRAKDQKYYVKFFLGGDVLTQTGQYLAARHHFAAAHDQPSEYLDVRVNGKIFFK